MKPNSPNGILTEGCAHRSTDLGEGFVLYLRDCSASRRASASRVGGMKLTLRLKYLRFIRVSLYPGAPLLPLPRAGAVGWPPSSGVPVLVWFGALGARLTPAASPRLTPQNR